MVPFRSPSPLNVPCERVVWPLLAPLDRSVACTRTARTTFLSSPLSACQLSYLLYHSCKTRRDFGFCSIDLHRDFYPSYLLPPLGSGADYSRLPTPLQSGNLHVRDDTARFSTPQSQSSCFNHRAFDHSLGLYIQRPCST